MQRSNKRGLTNRLLSLFFLGNLINTVHAGTPLWTFEPSTPTTFTISVSGTVTLMYQVTNQSRKTHTLVMLPIPGITQVTTVGNCPNPFTLSYQQSCTLTLEVDGNALQGNVVGGPRVCQQGSTLLCYQPSQANSLNITVQIESLSTLTGINPTSGSAAGGTGVTLTGTRLTGATAVTFGGTPATSVNVVNSTTVTAVTPAHAVGAVDVVISTPAGGATLVGGYTYVATAVGQPAYGGTIACLNTSVGNNLIAATTDNSASIIWATDGDIPSAESTTDGQTNTTNIVANKGTGSTYAAGLCSNYEIDSQSNTPCQAGNTCYSDWFLPAGNNAGLSGQLNCLRTNRDTIGGFISADYWSSTENDATSAYRQNFGGGSGQPTGSKNLLNPVRCVRAFTP